jgi:hypothetical protein
MKGVNGIEGTGWPKGRLPQASLARLSGASNHPSGARPSECIIIIVIIIVVIIVRVNEAGLKIQNDDKEIQSEGRNGGDNGDGPRMPR